MNPVTFYRPWMGYVLALVVAFAAGRYTMKSAVEKEAEATYEQKLSEVTKTQATSYEQKLAEQTETIKKQLEAETQKTLDTTKVTVTKKDGTTTVTEHTKQKETSKTKENTTADTTKKETSTGGTTSNSDTTKTSDTKEASKSTSKVTAPPSWRVYAAAAVTSPTDKRTVAYGFGTMYDLGPVNVGGFGLYSNDTKDTTLGITLGVSF